MAIHHFDQFNDSSEEKHVGDARPHHIVMTLSGPMDLWTDKKKQNRFVEIPDFLCGFANWADFRQHLPVTGIP